MRKRFALTYLFIGLVYTFQAQSISLIAGPFVGDQTEQQAIAWMMLESNDWKENEKLILPTQSLQFIENYKTIYNYDSHEYQFTEFSYSPKLRVLKVFFRKNKKELQDTLKSHQPLHDFSFLTGSCNFPYPFKIFKGKKRYQIFESMRKTPAEFMLWMGDNVYYLNGQWNSEEEMVDVWKRSRTQKETHQFLQSMRHYAIWDDHDYGPNGSGGDYLGKDKAFTIFESMWANPPMGTAKTKGTFFKFAYQDVDFFMLDSRSQMIEKQQMFGPDQIKWLKENLLASKAAFKFVIAGNQIMSSNKIGEDWGECDAEKADFFSFLKINKIEGLIFISGDRHYTELIKKDREEAYPIYEYTCSPMTSIVNPIYKINMKNRVKGSHVRKQNYGRISIEGNATNRRCIIETYSREGFLLWKKEILLEEIRYKD